MIDHAIDDPYRVLGVPRGSSDATIAAAYRSLARRFHPDAAGEGSTAQMIRINAAFDAIRSSERRAALAGASATAATRPRDPLRRRPSNDGTGGAGPPPGRPSGSVLSFGRHLGWSLGEIARIDPGYLDWLSDRPEGRPYADEIDAILRGRGLRTGPGSGAETGARTPRRRRTFGRG